MIAVEELVGWVMTKDDIFLSISTDRKSGEPVRGTHPLLENQMTLTLKQRAVAAGLRGDFPVHSFRSGEEVSRAFSRRRPVHHYVTRVWEQHVTAWRHMQLTQKCCHQAHWGSPCFQE